MMQQTLHHYLHAILDHTAEAASRAFTVAIIIRRDFLSFCCNYIYYFVLFISLIYYKFRVVILGIILLSVLTTIHLHTTIEVHNFTNSNEKLGKI